MPAPVVRIHPPEPSTDRYMPSIFAVLTHVGGAEMRKTIAAALLLALLASSAAAQDVIRYVGRDRKVKTVDPDQRLPVQNVPNNDPANALNSAESHQSSGGVVIAGPLVFYSFAITLSTAQGPGRVMIWDRTTVPPDGPLVGSNRPMRCFFVDTGDRTTMFSNANGLGMANGVAWTFSSGADCQTKTSIPANMVSISYKPLP